MYPTAEVRWFHRGKVPLDVMAWFLRLHGEPEEPGHRVDYYLRLSDADALGIKLRDGRIEIKTRCKQHGVVRLHERVAGRIERWRRWSFKLAEADGIVTDTSTGAPHWTGVEKERRLYRFGIMAHGQMLPVSAPTLTRRGCGLELTNINVAAQEWWSLGFEAHGDESTLYEDLLHVTQPVLGADEPPVLDARNSFGYPKWLATMQRNDKGER